MKIPHISLALFAVTVAGCGSETAQTPTAPETVSSAPAMSNDKMSDTKPDSTSSAKGDYYRVRGQVVEVMPTDNNGEASLMVKHETIPDFMEAMTMRLPLANAADASKVKAGDKIAFDMKKGNTEVSNIETLPPSTELKLAP